MLAGGSDELLKAIVTLLTLEAIHTGHHSLDAVLRGNLWVWGISVACHHDTHVFSLSSSLAKQHYDGDRTNW